MKPAHWVTVAALILIYLSLWFEWNWIWGLLFLMWTVHAVLVRETFLVQTVKRDDTPVLYWAVVTTWALLSVVIVVDDLINRFWS